jgi:DUF1680 family protein
MGSCTRQSWFDCSCCPTNLIRFLPSVPNLIYATKSDTAFVNLYIASKVKLSVGKRKLELTQQTSYPWKGLVKIIVNPASKTKFTLMTRMPSWAYNEVSPGYLYAYISSAFKRTDVKINGVAENIFPVDGYLSITREWSPGDTVTLEFPMQVHKAKAISFVNDDLNKVAFELGPIVYCAEEIDNPSIDKILLPEDLYLQVQHEKFLNDKVNILTSSYQNSTLKLIPYYLWSNRGVGQMKVWLPEK